VGFAIFHPEKLQSEQYQLRQQALLVIQQMGETPQAVDIGNIVAMANPVVEKLASPEASK